MDGSDRGFGPRVPAELRGYLRELATRVVDPVGTDLLGLWLIGSAALGGYEHGVSDIDVLAVSRRRGSVPQRQRLGARLVHPELPCETAGLEFVWYARPDLDPLPDPIPFQLNVNGGLDRAGTVQLAPDDLPQYWAVLDLAAARRLGVPLLEGMTAAEAIPPVPPARLRAAVRGSVDWHDGADAGSPNRVLNLARLLVLLTEDRWVSKQAGADQLRGTHPELDDAVQEALAARTQKRWMDPALAAPLSALLRQELA